MQVKKENRLKSASNFGSRLGLDSGDCCLMMTSEQFVTVNATRIPALTKSSKSENGMNVANNVIRTPANRAPFLGLPVASISPNI